MGTEIGYLQNKIRELKEENEELRKLVDHSLEREKRFIDQLDTKLIKMKSDIHQYLDKLLTKQLNQSFNDKLMRMLQNNIDEFNKSSKHSLSEYNKLSDKIIDEMKYFKKDNSIILNFMFEKLSVDNNEFQQWLKRFEKYYDSQNNDDYFDRFKLKGEANKKWV